jgi:hypothetical protein
MYSPQVLSSKSPLSSLKFKVVPEMDWIVSAESVIVSSIKQ